MSAEDSTAGSRSRAFKRRGGDRQRIRGFPEGNPGHRGASNGRYAVKPPKNMPTNPKNKGLIARSSSGIGAVSRAMIYKRAKELALMSGRIPPIVSEADYELAERELNGGPELDKI